MLCYRRINNTKNDYYKLNESRKSAVRKEAESWHQLYEEHYKNKTLPPEWTLYQKVAENGVAATITDRKCGVPCKLLLVVLSSDLLMMLTPETNDFCCDVLCCVADAPN